MLATIGFVTVLVLLVLLASRRVTPVVGLVGVPILAAIVSGHGASVGQYVTSGLQQTAPVVATFVFAILFFGLMTDAGLLDPVVNGVLRAIGTNPTRIVAGSAVLAAAVHLDGAGAVTFLVTIPPLVPVYERLRMDKRVLACVVAMAAGVMNIVPWGGPLLRASASLHVPVTDLFRPLLPVMAVGLSFVFATALWLGRRETRRLAAMPASIEDAIPVVRRQSPHGRRTALAPALAVLVERADHHDAARGDGRGMGPDPRWRSWSARYSPCC